MGQKFEWDEDKRLSNIIKHNIDFRDPQQLFDGGPVLKVRSPWDEEERFASTGIIGDKAYTVIWTVRQSIIRLISVRSARDAEERQYREVHG